MLVRAHISRIYGYTGTWWGVDNGGGGMTRD